MGQILANSQRLDVAYAAPVEISPIIAGSLDRVAPPPVIVSESSSMTAEARPIQSLAILLGRNAPCPQSC